MQVPLQITFRHMAASPAVEELVRARAAKLEAFAPRLVGCRVVLDAASAHHANGAHYRVHIDVTLPRHELVIGKDESERIAGEDLYAAIERAFDVAERVVEDCVRRERGDVKTHGR